MTIAAVPGPVRFARYAYGPNRLGYCGPDAADELLGEAAEGGDLRRIRALATGFEGVPARAFDVSLETRFKPRVRSSAWRWLATKAPDGAHPVHAFHVLDVFPVVGLLRGEVGAEPLEPGADPGLGGPER